MQTLSRRGFLKLFGATVAVGGLSACSGGNKSAATTSAATTPATSDGASEASESVMVRVASLSGPTTIGLVNMMKETTGVPSANNPVMPDSAEGIQYAYELHTSPDELLPLIIKGQVDIACIPSNAAAVIYNKTKGGVQVINNNTLGVLSVVTGDASIKEFSDLAGHTVYMSGQGSSPEYTLNYLLDRAGIKDQVKVGYVGEHAAVATQLASDPTAIGILPQPFTTATLAKNDKLSAPISLTDVWAKLAEDSSSQYVLGVTVVNTQFAKEHPTAVKDFLKHHEASVKTANDDPKTTAELVVEAGIVQNEKIAEKAIPNCNIVCQTGSEMKDALAGYLKVLAAADKKSVGGTLPQDDFYYTA